MADVAMPRLSDSMEEGTILKWLKSDGDEVSKGEELVEIETDKANMTYEADESGTLEIVAAGGRHAAGRRDDRADRRGWRWRVADEDEERSAEDEDEDEAEQGEDEEEPDEASRARTRTPRTRTRTRTPRTRRSPKPRSPREPEPEPDDDRVEGLADRPPDGAREGPRPVRASRAPARAGGS